MVSQCPYGVGCTRVKPSAGTAARAARSAWRSGSELAIEVAANRVARALPPGRARCGAVCRRDGGTGGGGEGQCDAQAFGDGGKQHADPVVAQQRRKPAFHLVQAGGEAASAGEAVGLDRGGKRTQQGSQAPQRLGGGGAGQGIRLLLQAVGQRDQRAERLVGGFQADQHLGAAAAGRAACAQGAKYGRARRLDRLACCAAEGAGVGGPTRFLDARGCRGGGGEQRVQVVGQAT